MNPNYIEKWNELAKKMQEPMQALAELNLKTLKEFDYLKPEELTKVKKPEEFMEKEIHRVIENSQKALNYLQQSFQIFEKILLSSIPEERKK